MGDARNNIIYLFSQFKLKQERELCIMQFKLQVMSLNIKIRL